MTWHESQNFFPNVLSWHQSSESNFLWPVIHRMFQFFVNVYQCYQRAQYIQNCSLTSKNWRESLYQLPNRSCEHTLPKALPKINFPKRDMRILIEFNSNDIIVFRLAIANSYKESNFSIKRIELSLEMLPPRRCYISRLLGPQAIVRHQDCTFLAFWWGAGQILGRRKLGGKGKKTKYYRIKLTNQTSN